MGNLRILAILILIGSQLSHLGAVSPDQTNLGLLIDENKKNLSFLNVALSNMAPPQGSETQEGEPTKNLDFPQYEIIKEINQLDFNGNMWYLQSNYSLAFRQLRNAQSKMKDGYEFATQKYLEDTRALLESSAPYIIRSEDAISKSLLRLGFRDLRNAEDKFLMAFNSSPYQYRYKILLYSEAITVLRRGKRFAILAMLASKTPDEDKEEYKYWSLEDLEDAKREPKEPNYERIRTMIANYIDNKRIERGVIPPANPTARPLDLFEQHDDNYGVITEGRLDLLNEASGEIKGTDAYDREKVPPIPSFDPQGNPIYE
jgi:AraC-like DNA-binding protein